MTDPIPLHTPDRQPGDPGEALGRNLTLRMTLLALHAIGCFALVAYLGAFEFSELEDILSALGFAVVMIAPIAILLLSRSLSYVSLIAAVIFSLGGFYAYCRAFFGPDVDAQAGLVLFFIPVYQMFAAVGLIVLARLAKFSAKHTEK